MVVHVILVSCQLKYTLESLRLIDKTESKSQVQAQPSQIQTRPGVDNVKPKAWF